jgi:hypothetical protein
MPRSFRSPLDGFDSPFGPTRIPVWLSAFAPWASYAYGTTGLTTPQYYNMSLAETRAGEALKLNAAGVYVGIPANTPLILGGAGHDVFGEYTNRFLAYADPIGQTITLPATGSYTLHCKGSGSVAVAAGTATISNAGSATDGSPRTIGCTATGTVSVTITGSPTLVWFTTTAFATPPVPTDPGAEILTNHDFASGDLTGWSTAGGADVTVVSNAAHFNSVSNASGLLQNGKLTAAKTYFLRLVIDSVASGSIRPGVGATTNGTARSAAGTYKEIRAQTGDTNFRLYAGANNTTAVVDSMSLREVDVATRNASISTVTNQPALGDFRVKLRPNITSLADCTFWSRGVDTDNEVRLSLVSGKVRLTITVGGVAEVAIETDAYSSGPGIVEIEAIAADGNQSISATGRTGATSTTAVTIPTGTIERFGGLGGTTFPNCTNMDFAVGPA